MAVWTLLMADLVDSTRHHRELGDDRMARLWREHDETARVLIREFGGRELARSDGFLVLFESPVNAMGFAASYHAALGRLQPCMAARVGVHRGPVELRENSADDRAGGALPYEVDGLALPVTARIAALALPGQTLLSAEAASALGDSKPVGTVRIGHWQLQGLLDPVALFATTTGEAAGQPPPDAAKAYRVIATSVGWMPCRDIPHRLPAERDAFVGRVPVLAALASALAMESRFVTLVGMGGIGKTRIALRHARRWLGDYPGGAWFCDLSTARTRDDVTGAIALGLDLPLGRSEPATQIATAIAARGACLVVFDNCEQVADHASAMLAAVLAAAPEARLLATSREVLGLAGEHVVRVDSMGEDEGCDLFVRRARAAGSALTPLVEAPDAIAELVHELDGMPLAIELAAAQTSLLSPPALLLRLRSRLAWGSARRGGGPRQATLRATLDWSWELLSEPERRMLAQLSVFDGGFTIHAAEAVVEVPAGSTDGVVERLQSLLDKSWLKRAGDERLDMLVSVRKYASEQLLRLSEREPELATGAVQRHFLYYTSSQAGNAELFAATELGNAIAACRRAVDRGSAQDAVAALRTVWLALDLRGPLGSASTLVNAVRSLGPRDPETMAYLERLSASASHDSGQPDAALRHGEAGLALLAEAPHSRLKGELLRITGEVHARAGRALEARAKLEEALDLARGLGDLALECEVLNSLGNVDEALHRPTAATDSYERALAIARSAGLRRWEGGTLGNLAVARTGQGRHAEAEALYRPAIEIAREVGNRRWEGNALCNLGLTLQALGRLCEARKRLEESLVTARHLGSRRLEGVVLCNMGIVSQAMEQPASARLAFEQAVEVARGLSDHRMEGEFGAYLARLEIRSGNLLRAEALLDRCESLLRDANDRQTLALVFCDRATLHLRRGDRAAAEQAQRTASAFSDEANLEASPELRAAMDGLERSLSPATNLPRCS